MAEAATGNNRSAVVVDPTENVKALNEAANKRQDDLREASERLQTAHIKRLEESLAHTENIAVIREEHAKEMRNAERMRLDSIRQVDVTAVKTEAERALAAIQTLAATTSTNAENLRNALTDTATTIAKQTSDTVGEITTRLAALEKSNYEGVGKQRLADPMMTELVAEMRTLRDTRAVSTGKSEGISMSWAILVAAAMLLFGGIGAVTLLMKSPPQQMISTPSR